MNSEEYLKSLILKLEEIKARKGKGFFGVEEKISDNTAKRVMEYFKGTEYKANLKKCAKCKGTWEVLIFIEYR